METGRFLWTDLAQSFLSSSLLFYYLPMKKTAKGLLALSHEDFLDLSN